MSVSHALRIVTSIAILSTLAILQAPALSQSPPGEGDLQLQGDGVITYGATSHTHDDLTNPTKAIMQGARLPDGGCSFRSPTLTATTPGTVVRLEELQYNPDTCQSLVVYGTASTASPETPGTPAPTGVGSADAVSGAISIGGWTTHAGYHRSWFEDIIRIDVNKVTTYVQWAENGSSVSTTSYGGNHRLEWLNGSGWYSAGSSLEKFPSRLSIHIRSYAHFKNPGFCALFTTNTYHNHNNVFGWYNGQLTGYVNWSKSGPCAGLLLRHRSQLTVTR